MNLNKPLLIALTIGIIFIAGCLTTPASQPGPSPAPPVAAALLVMAINATPARYSLVMSSTIGIRLTPANVSGILPPDAQFTWRTNYGTFYHWGPPGFRVVELAPEYTGTAEPVYWSYLAEQDAKLRPPVVVNLTVTESSTGSVLGSASLEIGWESPNGTVAVVEGEVS
ncbi:MAG TPA: hypothetical protein VLV30_07815 [Methanomicrobiales archaeon]|nr:hypothetical protein [Methanomicrobiales archaeon]